MRVSILPVLLVCGASLLAAPPDAKPDVEWAQRYYEKPQPERFETEMRLAQKWGYLSRPGGFYPTTSFHARLFAANPGKPITEPRHGAPVRRQCRDAAAWCARPCRHVQRG